MTPELEALIQQAAAKYNLPVDVFRRQLIAESGGDTNAVSPRGAQGVAQFMPGTAHAFGINPMDPAQAVPAAAAYMRQHLNRYGDDWQKALAAYNWGPGNLAKYGMANLPGETRAYIGKVLGSGPATSTPVRATPAPDLPVMPPPKDAPIPVSSQRAVPPPPAEAVPGGGGTLANMLAQLAQQGRDINKIDFG